jgi:biopolymer transport protein ExbD
MIDVVFLLLTFFVMTFKILVPEGDFNVQMAPTEQGLPTQVDDSPIQIRLFADADGGLAAIQLNDEPIDNFDLLRRRVLVASRTNPDLEVVLFPDEHLRYDYVIKAITAVNGDIRDGQIRTICSNIKFARQK